MKKLVSILLVLMIVTTGVFADAVPTLISELPFGLEQDGHTFTIILDENASTGYTWTYEFDESHVKYISDEYVNESTMPGAPGQHRFTFEVLTEGVSSIDFDLNRSFEENSSIDSVSVLVYKNGETVIIEENGIVTIAVQPISAEIKPVMSVYFAEEQIELDTLPQVIDGVYMVPVAETLRAMGYTVEWNAENQSIEISKGAQWTSITIGENAYFKNRMAARPLSAAPTIVNGRTMVPVEFFNEILSRGMEIENHTIKFNEFEMGSFTGTVKEIVENDGVKSLHIVYDETSTMIDVVIHTKVGSTFFQKEVQVGDQITALTSMAMTMSFPGQTAGYIIY